jgi:hypothetical protein
MTTTIDNRALHSIETDTEFRFEAAEHRYYWGEKEMSGVTSVLNKTLAKPALIRWAASMATEHVAKNIEFALIPGYGTLTIGDDAFWEKVLREARTAHCRIRDEAGEFGKERHAEIEAYVKACLARTGGKPSLPVPPESRHLSSFCAWAMRNNITFLQSEAVFYDIDLFVAGTADLVFLDAQGCRSIADVKIKKRIYGREPFLQMAAYHLLSESMGNPQGDKSVVLRIDPKTASLEERWSYNAEADKQAFKAVLQVYRYLQL